MKTTIYGKVFSVDKLTVSIHILYNDIILGTAKKELADKLKPYINQIVAFKGGGEWSSLQLIGFNIEEFRVLNDKDLKDLERKFSAYYNEEDIKKYMVL